MYKLDLPIDLKEAAAIERRRTREDQRKSRIFNAQERQFGIDRQALDQQLKEKHERDERERLRELAYEADAIRNDKVSCLLQRRQEADLRELERQLLEFRMLHQQPHTRREWDLNDPDARKKDVPARVCDDDPRCGISSLQKFDGEDLNKKARDEFQKDQMQNWRSKQLMEKKRAEEAKKYADHLYQLKQRELDARALELAAAEEECQRAIDEAVKNYNMALAQEQERRRQLKAQQEEDDRLTHIANAINSDLLTENPAQATSAFGPNRLLPDRFKGMSPAQLDEIKRINEELMKEKERLKEEEEREKKEWERRKALEDRAAILMEREIKRAEDELKRKLAEDNLRLAKQQKDYNKYLEKEVYTNSPTASYFMQFNTTSR